MSMKNSNDTIENRTRDLPAYSAVPQPTAPPRTLIVPPQHKFAFCVLSPCILVHRYQTSGKLPWRGICQVLTKICYRLSNDRSTQKAVVSSLVSKPHPNISSSFWWACPSYIYSLGYKDIFSNFNCQHNSFHPVALLCVSCLSSVTLYYFPSLLFAVFRHSALIFSPLFLVYVKQLS